SMAQLDDSVRSLMKALDDMGIADNTIVIFTTDNGAETFTWPDGAMTPFRASKGTIFEGGFRVPAICRWPGHVKPGIVENAIFSGLDGYPTLLPAAGNPNIKDRDLGRPRQQKLSRRLYPARSPARHEIFYFGGPKLGAVRVDNFKYQFYDQPDGWPGPKVET